MSIKSAHEVKAVDIAGNWFETGETWTYSSTDATVDTGVITVPTDATTRYSVGMKVKFTQPTDGIKYGIITALTATSMTVYLGTDYDLDNEGITSSMVSSARSPWGFPMSPAKWTATTTDTSNRTQATPTQYVWYNLGSLTISIPIGTWYVSYFTSGKAEDTSNAWIDVWGTLSTANNTIGDADLTTKAGLNTATNEVKSIVADLSAGKYLTLAAKTTYYLNGKTAVAGLTDISFEGGQRATYITAVCAYL
jgi:hypothetical protein